MQSIAYRAFRFLCSVLVLVLVGAGASPAPCGQDGSRVLYLDSDIFDTARVPFVPHTGTGFFQTYLILNVPYEPVRKLWKQLEKNLGQSLVNRGEAHVTVITPPEYERVLKSHLSMKAINEIALAAAVQSASLDVICLGRASATIEEAPHETYYLVVESPELLAIRRSVHRAFVAAGGAPEAFVPERFHPHVTIGFTTRDLHETDGVVKDASSADGRFRLIVGP